MKNLLLVLLFFAPSLIFSQKLKEYTASNGITYSSGDTVKLGRGSAPNGDFRYLEMAGWAAVAGYDASKGSSQFNAGRGYSGGNAVIKSIRQQKLKGATKVYFTVGVGNITNFRINIEDAIGTCEVTPCKDNVDRIDEETDTSDLDKLKKLKELLDAGAITEDEYNTQKKKILDNL